MAFAPELENDDRFVRRFFANNVNRNRVLIIDDPNRYVFPKRTNRLLEQRDYGPVVSYCVGSRRERDRS